MGDKWAKALVGSKKKLIEAGQTFRQWAPLKVYLSVARASAAQAAKPRISFSLRYQGQQVANLLVDGSPQLKIDKKTAETNKKYFRSGQKADIFGWRDKKATEFRKHFKMLGSEELGRSKEHRIESIFLEQMAGSTSKKFNGTLNS